MCGIWTKANFGKAVAREEILFPVAMLAHRGPDSYGWHHQDNVAMVHTRLSIIDLTTGGQPLYSYDHRYRGVINGELYDYQKIREALVSKGVSFSTKSDSEVLLNLFAHGMFQDGKMPTQLCGEFAFIFFDQERKLLHFGRDLHGVKPLFYQLTSDGITLASEIKALSPSSPEFSEDFVKTFLTKTSLPPLTALEGVFHVLPGRVYTLSLTTQELTWRYFQKLPLGRERKLRGHEAVDLARTALQSSVNRRLIADVEIGCYLSGGIDSALIAALAVRGGARPKAFTVGFADKDFDERDKAAEIANHLGLEHHVCVMNTKNFFESLVQSLVAFESPAINPHGAAKNLLAKMTSEKVKVVLSGEGSDEWFGGYAYLRIQKIQEFMRGHPRLGQNLMAHFKMQEGGRSLSMLDGCSEENKDEFERYFRGISPAVMGRLNKHRAYRYLTGEELAPRIHFICEHLGKYLNEDWSEFATMKAPSGWDFNTWCSVRCDLLLYILANVGDRQEMSHSLEGRTPFMDTEVLDIVSQIREEDLLRGLNEKWVLKQIAKDLLPNSVVVRRKHPFFAPPHFLYLRQYQSQIQHFVNLGVAATPWLPHKNWSHFLKDPPGRGLASLENLRSTARTTMFALGVLSEKLRESRKGLARGYRIPETVEDLTGYEVK